MKKNIICSIQEHFMIAVGTLFLAVGLTVFLVPFKLSSGGVSTLGTIFLYLFNMPISVTTLLFNGILFIVGYKYLGRTSVLKTISGILFFSLFLELTRRIPIYTDDILPATLIGGILTGLGIGIAVRQEASTGGSDFAALILNRLFPHISVSHWLLVIDCSIILVAGLVFGSLTVTFYSAITLAISIKTADWILTFGDAAKSLFILSPFADRISECIQTHFSRGTTGIYSRGMYEGRDCLMLLSVIHPKELPALLHLIRKIDKNAFVIISDVREVVGEGFGSGAVYDKIRSKKFY